MRWDDIPLFLSIARAGSLAGAARTLDLNAATVYRRLNALEEDLAARLFERERSGYVLTPVGEAMLAHAERVETAMLSLERAVVGQDQQPEGEVRVTAPESLLGLLAPLFSDFRERWPRIELQLTFSDRFFDLSRREADVAVRPSPTPPEDAVGRRMGTVAWAVFAPVRCPDGERTSLPWATYADDMAHLGAFRWRESNHGDETPMMAVNTVTAMLEVVASSRCRGLLPCFLADRDPRLLRLGDPIEQAASALWVLTHRDLRQTARVRVLLDHLYAGLTPLVPLLEGKEASGTQSGDQVVTSDERV